MNELTLGVLSTKDNIQICYDHYKSDHSKVIIIAPGFLNSKDSLLLKELAYELVKEYDVIMLDFRGHGKSQGRFYWTSKEYLDLLAVIEYAKKLYAKVGIIGFSLGAAASIIAASKTDTIDSLISVSTPTQFWKIDYHLWALDFETDIIYNLFGEGKIGKGGRLGPFWAKKERPIDLVNRIKTPILYLHGTRDWIIRPWHSRALYEKTGSKKKLTLVKNGLHAEYLIRKNKEETVAIISNWFNETMVYRSFPYYRPFPY